MLEKSIYEYILFGTGLRYLQDAKAGWPIKREDKFVLGNINRFLNNLDEFKLPVTKRAANDLIKFKEKMEKKPEDSTLTVKEANELKKIMKDLRKTLFAEAKGNLAFITTDKRIDINKLLYDVSSLFAPNVFNSLSDTAQYDFKYAGRCIGFVIPTAAAFHLLRATEDVLRDYYQFIYKRNRIKNLLWGPMINHLEKRKTQPIPPDVMLKNLDNIRVSFRNPTQHPDKIYDIEEVQDLFSLCIDVVNRMIADINK
jgi:hypothetical protein